MKNLFKKAISIMLATMMLLGTAPLLELSEINLPGSGGLLYAEALSSEEYASDGYTYTVDENGNATITDANSEIGGDVIIPLTLDGYPVVSIGDYAFYDCDNLTSVTAHNGITNIGEYAFAYCDNLAEIAISDNVTDIGYYAFIDTGYYNDETNWIEGMFYVGNHLIEVQTYNSNYGMFDSNIFSSSDMETINKVAEALSENVHYEVREGTVSICDNAFLNCANAGSLHLPSTLKQIGDAAFSSSLYRIEKITVAEGNEYFCVDEYGALINREKTSIYLLPRNNPEFTEYVVPEGVTKLDSIFTASAYLKSVTVADSVEIIDAGTFTCCEALEEIIINETSNLKSINGLVFAGTKIKELHIPAGVDSISTNLGPAPMFSNVEFERYIVDKDNSKYFNDEYGALYEKNEKGIKLIQLPPKSNVEEYIIPEGVTEIGSYAFIYCKNLKSISIPKTLEIINFAPFLYCNSLETFDVAEENLCFCDNGNTGLYTKDMTMLLCVPAASVNQKEFVIPSSVTNVDETAFASCSDFTLTITDNIQELLFLGMVNANEIKVIETNPLYSTEDGVLFNKDKTKLIKYPLSSDETVYYVPKSVTSIDGYAFTSVAFAGETPLYYEDWIIQREDLRIHLPGFYSVIHAGVVCTTEGNDEIDMHNASVAEEKAVYESWINFHHSCYNESSICSVTDLMYEMLLLFAPSQITVCSDEHPTVCQHKPVTINIPKTCTSQGETYVTCELCGEALSEVTVIPAGHTPGKWQIEKASTCKEKGKEVIRCTDCGEILETRDINKKDHRPGNWDIYDKPTFDKEGKKRRHCKDCHIMLDDVEMPKQKRISQNNEEAIFEYSGEDYSGEVDFIIKKSPDKNPQDVINHNPRKTRSVVYEISMTLDGKEIQPSASIRIKLLLPEGYNSNTSYVCYINTLNNTVERIQSEFIDGYLVFETTHFSYYAIVEEFDESVSIREPSRTEINYGDSIVLHSDVEVLPDGWTIKWVADNDKFAYTVSDNGKICTISPSASGETTFTATVYDAQGNEVSSDEQTMTSKAGFFDKIIAFFKKIFGLTKNYSDFFKGIY